MNTYTINTVQPVSIETAREYLNLDINNLYEYIQQYIQEGTGYHNDQEILRDITQTIKEAQAIKSIDHKTQADHHIKKLTNIKTAIEQKQTSSTHITN